MERRANPLVHDRGWSWTRNLPAFIMCQEPVLTGVNRCPKEEPHSGQLNRRFCTTLKRHDLGTVRESRGSCCTCETQSWDTTVLTAAPYKATGQCSLKQEATVPVNRFPLRTERVKLQQLQKSPERGLPGTLWCSANYFFFSSKSSTIPTPPLPENTYCNNCSKARTWKEERKRLMRTNNEDAPLPHRPW